MRWMILLALGACAARTATTAPPAAPTTPTETTTAPAPAPTANTLYRWYCFADTSGAGTDCLRTLSECSGAAADWANDDQDGDGVGDNQSTPCAGQQVAYCYSYVPDDSTTGTSLTLCQETMDSCVSSAGLSGARAGTQTACTETE